MKRLSGVRAVAFAEFAVILPVFLVVLLGAVDVGRMIFAQQVVANLSREAANLVSRGASEAEAIAATEAADDPLDIASAGGIIMSTIRRRSSTDGRPWIIEQVASGGLPGLASRLGRPGGPAAVPRVQELPKGLTLRAVEIVHEFAPVLDGSGVGLRIYPSTIYDVAFF